MILPILISNNGDILIYQSTADVEEDLEVVDVLDGQYSAYDSSGQPLNLTVEDGQVKVYESSTAPSQRKALMTFLRAWLKQLPEPNLNLDAMTLEELVRERTERENAWSYNNVDRPSVVEKVARWLKRN